MIRIVLSLNSTQFTLSIVGTNIDFCNNAALYLNDTNKKGKFKINVHTYLELFAGQTSHATNTLMLI